MRYAAVIRYKCKYYATFSSAPKAYAVISISELYAAFGKATLTILSLVGSILPTQFAPKFISREGTVPTLMDFLTRLLGSVCARNKQRQFCKAYEWTKA
jgi:hypothetical protein